MDSDIADIPDTYIFRVEELSSTLVM